MNQSTEKNLQIDILPIKEENQILKVHLYIDGICYTMHTIEPTVLRMLADGIVKQVQGHRHNEKFELEPFDYPTGVDSAGVKYTSEVYVMKLKY